MDIREKEAREIEAFERSVSKTEFSDESLVIPDYEISRYRRPYTNRRFPIDLLFKTAGDLDGLRVLDMGCGDGFWSVMLGLLGGRVAGFDISESLTGIAKRRADVNGMGARVNCLLASAHNLPFLSESFDLVFGNAILHHLDLGVSRPEFNRVLRKGGRAIFREPVALSATLRRLRKSRVVAGLVSMNRISADEEPLNPKAIENLGHGFTETRIYHAQMISRLERIFGEGKPYELLNALDIKILQYLPPLRRFARQAVIELVK